MNTTTWTSAKIDDKALRAFIQGLEGEGFTNVRPDLEYGFQFDPMSGSEAGLKAAMKKAAWEAQMNNLVVWCDDEEAWVYYVCPTDCSESSPMVGVVPQKGMIYVS